MRLAIIIALLLATVAGFGGWAAQRTRRAEAEVRARDLTGGNPERGKVWARELGCVACHIMPGVRGPESSVGPSLEDFALRSYVAGAAENTPDNLQKFLRDPRSVAPKSAMPHLKITEAQAQDLAAYLYTQR
jgi:cytochrome c2